MSGKYIEILLVEDDAGDVDLTRETLREGKILVNLNVVEDGVKALEYLRKEGNFKNASRPDLVLLDLNLPRRDGRQVLSDIKNDPNFKSIPVIVLTTSDADADVLKSYGLGGNCYVTKPVGLDQFTKVVQGIEDFWFGVVKLPPRL